MNTTRHVAQEPGGPAGTMQERVAVRVPSDFENERTVKVQTRQLLGQGVPGNLAFARWQVIVAVAVVVAGMDHPEVARKLVGDRPQIAGKMSVARVETDTHFSRFQRTEHPEHVSGAAEE